MKSRSQVVTIIVGAVIAAHSIGAILGCKSAEQAKKEDAAKQNAKGGLANVMQLIGRALVSYADDNNGLLPPANYDLSTLPMEGTTQLGDPKKIGLEFNPALAGARLDGIADPANTSLVRTKVFDEIGMRGWAMADSHGIVVADDSDQGRKLNAAWGKK